MQIVAKLDLKGLEQFKADKDGAGQMYIDQECIRLLDPYTPNMNGGLIQSLRTNSVIGSGQLNQITPYARYLYYGYLMVDPITGKGCFRDKNGRMWSRPNVSKVLTKTPLNFNQSRSPMAGPHWFDRMKKDHLEEIGQGLAKVIGGHYERH